MPRRPFTPRLTVEARALGFETLPMTAAFRGGRCGLCGSTIPRGEQIVRFRGRGWCHVPCTTQVTTLEEHLRNCARPHDDPMVAAAYEKSRPEAEAKLARLLTGGQS